MKAVPPKSSRTFSRLGLIVNTGLAWFAILYGVHKGSGLDIATPALALIGTLYGLYVGIGHLDYRKVLSSLSAGGLSDAPQIVPGSDASGAG